MKNYDNVISQIQAHGLILPGGRLEIGRLVRCPVQGDREKRGWYAVHRVTINGDDFLVGGFGIWHGADNGAQKIEIDAEEISAEDKAAIRKRIADDKARADQLVAQEQKRAARHADHIWRKLADDGESDYLKRKGLPGIAGARYSPKGALVVPMLDRANQVVGLQIIHAQKNPKTGTDKEFFPKGCAKKGSYFVIGMPAPGAVCLVAEGLATAHSLNLATGLPVIVGWDANSLTPAVKSATARYKGIKLLFCADDDGWQTCKACKKPVFINENPKKCPECGEEHGKQNAGANAAQMAALAFNGRTVTPRFSNEAERAEKFAKNGTKITDFDDLRQIDGLHTVRQQIEAALLQAGWSAAATRKGAEPQKRGGGDGNNNNPSPIQTVDELLERFSLVLHMGGTVFDHAEHCLATLSDMRDACTSREIHRRWQESPERRIVRKENVGFDPAETDPMISCNLWNGWPTIPKAGDCAAILELLRHMTTRESNSRELFEWILKWIAYPLQNPGAKMRTTIVVAGPQGTGKNLFFETVMSIYGKYGRIIDQASVEDKFNDWASGKLFLIADEVIARQDLYHVKNKLKSFITGEWIRINPKNVAAYDEKNHVNLVFLSNERMPVVIDEDDRRHTVLWTPEKLDAEFYREVSAEIKNGGREALFDYLLNLDLGDFNEHTKPPMTDAKKDLIELGKDNISRFYDEYLAGEILPITEKGKRVILPALSNDLYELYRHWCIGQGVKSGSLAKVIDAATKTGKLTREVKRYGIPGDIKQARFVYPMNATTPDGTTEQLWLQSCVETFKNNLRDLKGAL